ncbi:hypothetical protein TBR22_A25730 [Luteitalea sp. TBR-22]|uniref:porin n=1 Tax=Luteitalea sp. TBR-22 TaxID=2802971 RepID=UPI001AF838E2|nr:porin [Luteitalea sp. TBR-22]BCS33346.1 hypothetical protein TBR22_A25730 [Luteitalea sp. TBR-22]
MNIPAPLLSSRTCRFGVVPTLFAAWLVSAAPVAAQTTVADGAGAVPVGTSAALVEKVTPVEQAQDASAPQPTTQPAEVATPGPTNPWLRLFGPTKVSTTGDTYYAYNGNEPSSGKNVLRNFDENDNQFSGSYFEVAFEQVPTEKRRLGFRTDIGFGPTATWVNSTDPDDGALKYLQQAYVSVLAPVGRGLQFDVGKFNTPIGAEPTETAYNWNYSRSLLFSWAAPYYHLGVRASLPVSDTVSVSGYLINGWNNARDNNRGKTMATTVSWKVTPALTLSQAWMGGPEGPNGAAGWRNLYDTIATWTVNPRLTLMTNIDIGRDTVGDVTNAWQGIAGYGRVTVLPAWALATRVEVFEDRDGYMTGTAQTIKELTLTSEHTLVKGLALRVEYRRDWSDEDFFEYRTDQFRPQQNTILFGFTYAVATP